MTTYTTSVNAPDVETLIMMVQDVVIGHHKVEDFDHLRSSSKLSLEEWYTKTSTILTEGGGLTYGYMLYSGDPEWPSETLLKVIAPGYIRVQSSIQ